MNPPNRRYFRRSARSSGAALIITLAFLVLVAIMVVGMMESVRVERSASRTHYERMRATTFAQQGVDRALASLRQATADRPQQSSESDEDFQKRTRNWASQPGRLLIPDPELVDSDKSVDRKRIAGEVPLNSGVPTPELLQKEGSHPEFLRPPDLNIPTLLDPHSHLITEEEILDDGTNSGSSSGGTSAQKTISMNVRWIYVRKDGTYAKENGELTDLPDLNDKLNPIVGRFAYWTDDEGTKVNYNLAWSRHPSVKNPNGKGHQTRVGLDALLDTTPGSGSSANAPLATRLHQFVTMDNFENIGRFFNTPFEARQVALANGSADPALTEALRINKFNLTHYNADPDTTFYGLPRLMLTTKPSNAVRRDNQGNIMMKDGRPVFRPFLDILKRGPNDMADKVDPGYLSNIDGGTTGSPGGKLHLVVQNLVENYLKKTDWPMVGDFGTGAKSLQEKYYGRYTDTNLRNKRLAQLALNIIEYVRSAESSKPVVEPIRGMYRGNTFVADFVDGGIRGNTDSFKGVVRAPMITEMGMWISKKKETVGPNKDRYKAIAFVEVYLPEHYGLDPAGTPPRPRVDLTGLTNPALGPLDKDGQPIPGLLSDSGKAWGLYFKEMGNKKYTDRAGKELGTEYPIVWRLTSDPSTVSSPVFPWDSLGKSNRTVAMGPGEYRLLAFEGWRQTNTGTIDMRAAITIRNAAGFRIDVAPLSDQGGDQIKYNLVPTDFVNEIATIESDDPRVNGLKKDWQPSVSATKNTMFGTNAQRRNSRWVASVGGPRLALLDEEPTQDLDRNGRVTDISFRMPYPKEHLENERGLVRSSGEMGLIHTGIEGNNAANSPDKARRLGGVPWRTLRLQPSDKGVNVVPDWAFMDLFTVPADVPEKAAWLFNPHTTATGGRVNMNAHPEPFTMNRIAPLAAVLANARKHTVNENERVSYSEAQQVAANIYNRVLAKAKSGLPGGKAYGATGDFAHYESPGEVVEIEGVASNGEESEELVREIANLISSRSNVFTVYTVGQALRQTPDGKLLITSEQRQQAMLERFVESDLVTGADAIDYTKFRTVYFRNLIP